METLGIEQAMKQCWEQVWPEVRAEVAQGVSVASSLVVMRRLMELMQRVCAAGVRAWLEQADCSDDTLERDGRRLRFKLGLRTLIKSDRWNTTWSRYLNTLQTA
ncbi:MAG: hypothetical protein IAG10_31735 [Planctomycetaceae bacterium]|nr:hypothetical protein [Planctomycetaceae bacterium]